MNIKRARMEMEDEINMWINQIVRIKMLARPTYELTPSGLNLISDGLSEHMHELIRQCEENISIVHTHYGEWMEKRRGR